MPFLTEDEISNFFFGIYEEPSNRKDYSLRSGRKYHGHEPRLPKPSNWTAQELSSVYFYYLKILEDGSIRSRVYRTALPNSKVDDFRPFVPKWIGDTGGQHKDYVTSDLESVDWEGPSYICYFIDNEGWRFIDDDQDGKENRSIHFFEDQTNINRLPIGNGSCCNSKTYWFEHSDSSRGKAKCLVVENHHLAGNSGRPRKDVPNAPIDYFKYDLFFKVELEVKNNSGKKLVLIIDPGARNTGP